MALSINIETYIFHTMSFNVKAVKELRFVKIENITNIKVFLNSAVLKSCEILLYKMTFDFLLII